MITQFKWIILLTMVVMLASLPDCFAQTVTNFYPGAGPVGASIRIDGSGFIPLEPIVRFNGVTVNPANVEVTSNTRLYAIVPAGATTGRVSVQTTGPEVFSPIDFYVGSGPYVTGFSPNVGGPSGNTQVGIEGFQFFSVTSVKFNGVNAASFLPNGSGNYITSHTPAGVTTGPITVTAAAGSYTSIDLFYVPPVITGFAPTSGPAGTDVTVTGQNFLGTTGVKFNGISATFVVNNNTSITATIPTGATSGKLVVDAPAGSYQTSGQFFVTPTISGFAPEAGSPGTTVTIVGNDFNAGTPTVKFNGVVAALNSFNATQISANVPNGATTGPISVTTVNGTTTTTNFFYLPPIISSFTPTNSAPGSTVTVQGANFLAATSVKFHGQEALLFSVTNNNQLTAIVPNGVNTGPISVTGPGGTGVSSGLFYAMPVITGFLPASGLPGTNVTVFGNNFQGTSSVKFNGVTASFTGVISNQLTAVVPGGATDGPITITAPAGTATSPQNFVLDYRSDVRINTFNDSPDPLILGNDLTYVIVPANSGPSDAPDTQVSIGLASGLTLKSANTTQGTLNTNENPIIVSLGTMTTFSFPTITLVVTPQSEGSIQSTATISSTRIDPLSSNNTSNAVTTVLPVPRLAIRQVAGDKVRVSWPVSLTNFVLQDKLDLATTGGWTNVSGTPSISGNERVLTNTIAGTNRFYRLRK